MGAMSNGSGQTPGRTILTFIRHGQSTGNQELRYGGHGPSPLSERGRHQARATARALQEEPVSALYSSDLPRALETAEAIGGVLGRRPVGEAALRERSLGDLDGLRFEEVATRFPESWRRLRAQDPEFRPPGGGETIDEVFDRVSSAVDQMVAEHRGGHVVAVSHGLAIFHAFAHICGLGSPSRGLPVFMLVDNCSLSRFVHRPPRWRILAINDCAHLGDLATPELYPA